MQFKKLILINFLKEHYRTKLINIKKLNHIFWIVSIYLIILV